MSSRAGHYIKYGIKDEVKYFKQDSTNMWDYIVYIDLVEVDFKYITSTAW